MRLSSFAKADDPVKARIRYLIAVAVFTGLPAFAGNDG
ncbi:MAG: hypothetical protein OJF62_002550 [Pseudolabrys sp.]|nr:hypothetical protein [Pseudolabrys sp.]